LQVVLEKLTEYAATNPVEEWVLLELASLTHSLAYLPRYQSTEAEAVETRRREQVIVRWRLLGLFDKSEPFRQALESALRQINGDPTDPTSFDTLDNLLNTQPYRLAYWRVATDEINYRRFFDINDMVAVRIEEPRAFEDVHRLAFKLLGEGKVTGLRIDHPDGLWDPETYFWRLQQAYLQASVGHQLGEVLGNTPESAPDSAPDSDLAIEQHLHELRRAQPERAEWPLYVLAEKILSDTEPLPYTWAVHGTTGYDFMYAVNNLLVDAQNGDAIEAIYTDFRGEQIDFHDLTDFTKKLVMRQSLSSELDAISAELDRILEQNRRYRGYTRNSLAFGLSEFIAALEIYRTYISEPGDVSDRDRAYIEAAAARAAERNPLVPSSIFEFLRETLLMRNFDSFTESQQEELRNFVMRFQQITGPVMAKSVEDTAFYSFNRLTSLNEVGGHPDRFGASVADFHAHNVDKAYPYTMLSTSTHDTKRSEDVRARIHVLSELPDDWRMVLNGWAAINAAAKTDLDGQLAPAPNDEYLLYQTLLGVYQIGDDDDLFCERIIAYMHKAINEAKVHSNWINPNDAYAQAITDFVYTIWQSPGFRALFDPFHARIAYFGYHNSLSQLLLKLTCPGVPDIYQGNELWDFSLVDPDNRRPVDWAARQTLLEELQAAAPSDRQSLAQRLLTEIDSGAIKLYLTYCVLNFRREVAALFREGAYIPLEVTGPQADHLCAFLRTHGGDTALVLAPRLFATLAQGELQPPLGKAVWNDTQLVLPATVQVGTAENILTGVMHQPTGRTFNVGDLLQDLPVALLHIR
jgi:(1->4)-alpha-D-glucan 1-alpha-D-glucosylmutase